MLSLSLGDAMGLGFRAGVWGLGLGIWAYMASSVDRVWG